MSLAKRGCLGKILTGLSKPGGKWGNVQGRKQMGTDRTRKSKKVRENVFVFTKNTGFQGSCLFGEKIVRKLTQVREDSCQRRGGSKQTRTKSEKRGKGCEGGKKRDLGAEGNTKPV